MLPGQLSDYVMQACLEANILPGQVSDYVMQACLEANILPGQVSNYVMQACREANIKYCQDRYLRAYAYILYARTGLQRLMSAFTNVRANTALSGNCHSTFTKARHFTKKSATSYIYKRQENQLYCTGILILIFRTTLLLICLGYFLYYILVSTD